MSEGLMEIHRVKNAIFKIALGKNNKEKWSQTVLSHDPRNEEYDFQNCIEKNDNEQWNQTVWSHDPQKEECYFKILVYIGKNYNEKWNQTVLSYI